MEKQAKADKPFFLWYNSTAMHFRTHVAEKNLGKSGQDPYSDRMVVHDEQIGQMLDKLDELGIADNTIVMYSTDNGPENDTWPDGANTPFRGQKDSNWEGGWRVPCFMRWPGKIKAGSVLNGIVSHIDMFPTLLAIAGNPDVTEQLLDGCTVDGKTFNVHLDGYNQIPYLTGEVEGEPEKRDHLLQRRRRRHRGAGRRLQVQPGGATRQHDAAVGRAVREAAAAVHHEPAPRPVRAGRVQLEHLPGLDGRSRAADVPDAGGGRVGRSPTSPSSRRGRSPPRSTWTRCWRRWRRPTPDPRLRRRLMQGGRRVSVHRLLGLTGPCMGPSRAWAAFRRRDRSGKGWEQVPCDRKAKARFDQFHLGMRQAAFLPVST